MKPFTLFRRVRFSTNHSAWLIAISLSLGALPATLAQDTPLVPVQQRIMHLTPQQQRQMMLDHLAAPQISAPPGAEAGFASSINLLPHVPYIPSERNQGSCGDCWQWAGTGVIEVAHDVQDNIHDRLSVQFLNSCQVPPNPYCCDGGWLANVTYFYTHTKQFTVPWSNPNGAFTSGNGTCSKTPCGVIVTTPNYPLQSISTVSIATWGVGQAQAIANIKSVLNQNKAIWFAFYLPNNGWNDFDTFWVTQPESTVWTNFYCGNPPSGGHAVLCVGYNDDDPNNRYWIILNSWGSSNLRPNGLFRVSMDLDYDCVDSYGDHVLTWETLNVQFVPQNPPVINTQPQSQSILLKGSATFTVSATGDQPMSYQWLKQGSSISGATASAFSVTAARFADAGTYSVVVSNPAGKTTSSNAVLSVLPPVSLPVALNNNALTYTTAPSTFWFGQADTSHDGVASAQSYPISDGQQSTLSTTLTGPGTLSFWWKVSSQANADFLTFSAFGDSMAITQQISGEVDWQQVSYLLQGGPLTLQWTYAKDATASRGSDAGWVDQVSFVSGPILPTLLTQPVSQGTFAASPVTFTVSALGTPPLSYQWRFNGAPIPGATSTCLLLANPCFTDGGLYSVQVSSPYGVTNSVNASLAVVPLAVRGDDSLGQLNFSLLTTNAVALAAGGWHSLILCRDGSLLSFGDDCEGQCDLPPHTSDTLAIAAGGYHSLALKFDGTVSAWGDNFYGQATVPAGLSNVLAIAAGAWHSLALRADGTVLGWGLDTSGQTSVPPGLSNIVAIAAGGSHSLALCGDGTVVAWGDNYNGPGDFSGQSIVPYGLSNVVAISAGDYHSLAIKGDGTVVCWGDDSDGQCDPPTGLSNVVAIAGGGQHTVALKADSTVSAWGNDWNGQCDFPPGLSNVITLAAGHSHTILLQGVTSLPPQVARTARANGRFSLAVQTFAGKHYTLEYKNSLASSVWTSLASLRGNGTPQLLTDPIATAPQRFYRVREW